MKKLMTLLLILIAVSISSAATNSLSDRLFAPDGEQLLSSASGSLLSPLPSYNSSGSNASGSSSSGELNPGKALLLSAIMPGTGEYYAGYKWRAAAFFLVEVAAWTGVIYFYNQGMDKDKEFKKFADTHFDEHIYRQREFELARDPQWGDSGAYTRTETEWLAESWNTKIHYLPSQGFTHELPSREERSRNKSQDQQYYEMIGKYIRQFGFAWDDAFGDDAGTPWFDGTTPRSILYMDMRYDSNQLLQRSSLSIQIAMLNHVASALHASFTVRALKRKAEAQVGFRAID